MKRFTIPRIAHCDEGCELGPGQDGKRPPRHNKKALFEGFFIEY